MTAMKNIVGVKIYNRPFNLSTDETEGYIRKIAGVVDAKVRSIISSSPSTNIIDAAILAALEAVDEKQKAAETINNLRSQIKDYVDDAGEARLKCDEAQKELRELKTKCAELEKEVEIRRMFNKKLETEAAVAAQKAKDAEEKAKAAAAAAAAAEVERKKAAEEKAKADAAKKAEAEMKKEAEAKAAASTQKTSSSSIPPVSPIYPDKKTGLY